jgi:hypothetical protein
MLSRPLADRSRMQALDVAVLIIATLDMFAEQLVWFTLLLWLGDNLRGSNFYVSSVMGLTKTVAGVVVLCTGGLLDHFPKGGPLSLLAMTNPPRIVIIIGLVAGEWLSGAFATSLGNQIFTAGALIVPYAIADGFDALAFSLTINRITQNRGRPLRRRLFYYVYALGNVVASAIAFGTAGLRYAFADQISLVNRLLLVAGCGIWVVSAIAAKMMAPYIPPPMHGQVQVRIAGSEPDEPAAGTAGDDEADADDDTTARLLTEGHVDTGDFWSHLSSPQLLAYLILILCMSGVAMGFVILSQCMPYYTIRRFDAPALFAIFQAINPTLTFLLCFIMPGLDLYLRRRSTYLWIVVGTTLMTTSTLWIIFVPEVWGVAVFQIHWTFGEVMAVPRFDELEMNVIPRGLVGWYLSAKQVPHLILRFLAYGASGMLLETFCASPETCRGSASAAAAQLWLWLAILLATTPIALCLYWRTIGREKTGTTQTRFPGNARV